MKKTRNVATCITTGDASGRDGASAVQAALEEWKAIQDPRNTDTSEAAWDINPFVSP
jgi:hypothetical protein